MHDRHLQHPEITRALRTGYPRPGIGEAAVPVCRLCGYAVRPGELYGACGGKLLCGACADDEWRELSTGEKLSLLGYDQHTGGEYEATELL